jgi:predicted O-methyltransferase YrrM
MIITNYIVEKSGIDIVNEPTNKNYSMFNTGGVECEVGEFLYSLVRLLKPNTILETGTHYGISSTYFALALKHNCLGGTITTIDTTYHNEARTIHSKLELVNFINQIEMDVLNFKTDSMFDIIFLDTEPHLRFDEFTRYYDNLKDGGIIIIHDLHPHLSYNLNYINDVQHWPYGDFRPKIGKFIKEHSVQTFSLNTPRGLTVFQKKSVHMSYVKYINNEL